MGDSTNPNNSHGFQEDDHGIWPDSSSGPSANTTGDPGKDFDGMTWKQIEAAILGGGAMTGGQDNLDRAYGNVNWQSLQAAAGVFQTTQLNLAAISQAIKDQSAALVGDDGPWKGTAADNFKVMTDNLAAKFDALVHMISDGGGGARDIPTQLVNSAAYLQWAQNTLRYIDSYYAAQVNARGHTLNDGRAHIADFPDAVDMMTNDMRQVGNTLSGKYNTFATASYAPPPPGQPPTPDPSKLPPPPGGDGGGGDGNVPPPNIPPPPGGSGGGDGGGAGGNVPPPNIPPPPGDTGGGAGGNVPPPNIPPPPGDTGGSGGGGTPPPFKNLAVSDPNLDSAGGGGPGGAGLNNLTSPNLPPPPGGDNGATGGNGPGGQNLTPPFSSPNLPPPPGSSGGGTNDPKGGGTGNIKPPALTPPPGDTGGNLGNIKPPALTPPPGDVKGGGGPGLGDTGGSGGDGAGGGLGNIKPPAISPPPGSTGLGGNNLTNNALNPADLPPALQNTGGDTKGGGITPPPMVPPGGMGGTGGLGNQGTDRPDSSGLLGGVDKPWLSNIPKGIGDPNSLGDTPPLSHASWAPPPADAGGDPGGTGGGGLGDTGLGGAGGDGPGSIKGLDSSALVPPPDLPDALTDPTANANHGPATAGGGTPTTPMMPPGGTGSGMGGLGANQGTDRPDSSGLLGGVDKPWLADVPKGIGDPNAFGDTPPLKAASWAPPPGAGGDIGDGAGDVKGLDSTNLVPPDLPDALADPNTANPPATSGGGTPGMPMMPPGGMGSGMGAANTAAADRPDSSGLLGGVDNAWHAGPSAGVGDPNSAGDTPPSKAADWAPPPLSTVDTPAAPDGPGTPAPQVVAAPQNGAGPLPAATPAGRPESASLLDGSTQPWTGDQAPAGEPAVVTDTPAATAASWSAPPAETGPGPVVSPGDQPAPAPSSGWATSDVPVVVPPVQAGWGVAGSPAPQSGTPAPAPAPHAKQDKEVPQGGVGGGEPDEVRIAVVQAAEVEDTSAWDTGTEEFLPGLLPSSLFAQQEEREDDFVTDLVERSDKPWRPATAEEDTPQLGTYQRVKGGDGVPFFGDEMPTCAPGPATEPGESEEDGAEAADGEEDEEAERTMADLLSQDESAWGRPASKPTGVLE